MPLPIDPVDDPFPDSIPEPPPADPDTPSAAAPEPPAPGAKRKRAAKHLRVATDDDEPAPTGLLLDPKGVVLACEHNALLILQNAPEFKDVHFDEFLYRIRIGERDWTDADVIRTQIWLQSTQRQARFSKAQAGAAITNLAHERPRDSLREFIDPIKFLGATSIDEAFIKGWGCEDNELNRAASRNFFIALAARAMEPGAQVDTIWVFEGPQGTKKSQALRALGGDFHAEIGAQIGTTDFLRELRGIWIAELSEMDSLRGKESSTIKRLLSAPKDRFVEKFEKYAEVYRRRAVAVGTTNDTNNYWQDPTGARRLVPIKTGIIDVPLIELCRKQWFAEAADWYASGESWWDWPDSIKDAQDARQLHDPWEDVIRDGIINGLRNGSVFREPWPEDFISSSDLASKWLRLDAHQQGQAMSKRIGAVMRKLGFEPAKQNRNTRGWAWAGPESIEKTFRTRA